MGLQAKDITLTLRVIVINSGHAGAQGMDMNVERMNHEAAYG